MSNMIINIPPGQSIRCDEYEDDAGMSKPKSIIITPLRVTLSSEDSYKVSFGCNMWKSCHNEDCSYCFSGMGGRYQKGAFPDDNSEELQCRIIR